MSEWGRKEYRSWPSRKPLASYEAFFVAVLVLAGMLAWQYTRQWSFAEREYLRSYILSETLGTLRENGHYRFVTYLDPKGVPHIASNDEIERIKSIRPAKYRVDGGGMGMREVFRLVFLPPRLWA
jgi:hypothetical protein